MTIGARRVLEEYGDSPLAVAEALLRNEIKPHDMDYAAEAITPMIMEAAKFRVEHAGKSFLTAREPARTA